MKIAIEGCAHGDIEKIYGAIQLMEQKHDFKVDLLICCGDFQAVRNERDLECVAVPKVYRKMQTFHKYYSGELQAPILTIFIGGNHEASNHLAELPYGGWVCPNIYYLGYAGVVQIGGLRIGGLSGIYKKYHYHKGRYECYPFDGDTKRSIYHVRNIDVFRLKQMSEQIDIFISHDWPQGVYHHGSVQDLLRMKPGFTRDIECDCLGSEPSAELLNKLQPRYWFAAHLHVKFSALVKHDDSKNETRFLALDKCLPRRKFLQILDIPHNEEIPLVLRYDPEWMCILRSTDHLMSIRDTTQLMPDLDSDCNERCDFTPSTGEKDSMLKNFENDFTIPLNFTPTAPIYNSGVTTDDRLEANPQTRDFCEKINIRDPLELLLQKKALDMCDAQRNLNETNRDLNSNLSQNTTGSLNPDEISVSDDDDNM